MRNRVLAYLALVAFLSVSAWINFGNERKTRQGYTAGPQHQPGSVAVVTRANEVNQADLRVVGAKFNREMEAQLAIYTISQH